MANRLKIFVGSSSEAKPIAVKVCEELAKHEFQVLPWWDTFALGETTLETLERLARDCFGAVFVFAADDETISRNQRQHSTRDNVIFEYGIFVSQLTRRRAIAVVEKNIKRPTDFIGTTDKVFDRSFMNFSEVIEHFTRAALPKTERTPLSSIPIFEDSELNSSIIGSPHFPTDWHERRLYVGITGAKNWIALSEAGNTKAKDSDDEARHTLQAKIKEAVSLAGEVNCFVSFGPGDARLDEELVAQLRNVNPRIRYVPVDLNHYLVRNAIDRVGQAVDVPFGIVADFEDRPEFVMRRLNAGVGGPRVYGLLGNTLANLDRKETRFLTRVRDGMSTNDFIVLDVVLKGSKWSKDADVRMSPAGYSSEYRQFLATSLAWVYPESVSEIAQKFEEKFAFKLSKVSDVPQAEVIHVFDARRNRIIAKNTRYDWTQFLKWLRESLGFNVVFAETIINDDILSDGVLLLRKAIK